MDVSSLSASEYLKRREHLASSAHTIADAKRLTEAIEKSPEQTRWRLCWEFLAEAERTAANNVAIVFSYKLSECLNAAEKSDYLERIDRLSQTNAEKLVFEERQNCPTAYLLSVAVTNALVILGQLDADRKEARTRELLALATKAGSERLARSCELSRKTKIT